MVSSEPEPEPDERFSFGLSTSAPLLGPGEYLKHRWPESGATAAAEERPRTASARSLAQTPFGRSSPRSELFPVAASPTDVALKDPGALERASFPRVRTTQRDWKEENRLRVRPEAERSILEFAAHESCAPPPGAYITARWPDRAADDRRPATSGGVGDAAVPFGRAPTARKPLWVDSRAAMPAHGRVPSQCADPERDARTHHRPQSALAVMAPGVASSRYLGWKLKHMPNASYMSTSPRSPAAPGEPEDGRARGGADAGLVDAEARELADYAEARFARSRKQRGTLNAGLAMARHPPPARRVGERGAASPPPSTASASDVDWSGQHGKYGYASVCGGGSTWMQQLVAMEYGIAVERRENENHVRARTRAHEAVIAEAAKAARARIAQTHQVPKAHRAVARKKERRVSRRPSTVRASSAAPANHAPAPTNAPDDAAPAAVASARVSSFARELRHHIAANAAAAQRAGSLWG